MFFLLLPFCYISCLLTCTMVQSTAASGVTIARLCSKFYIGNMQIQCSIKILKDFNSEIKADFTA